MTLPVVLYESEVSFLTQREEQTKGNWERGTEGNATYWDVGGGGTCCCCCVKSFVLCTVLDIVKAMEGESA
jgi:hypothetical protein